LVARLEPFPLFLKLYIVKATTLLKEN